MSHPQSSSDPVQGEKVSGLEARHPVLARLIDLCKAADGQPPFSDQSLVELLQNKRKKIEHRQGVAIVSPTEFELAVEPEFRRNRIGAELVGLVLRDSPEARLAWSHGDHPASRALAERFGFRAIRSLLQLRANVTAATRIGPSEESFAGENTLAIQHFRPGLDDAAWLALNARAFANHPEQGSLSNMDLAARISEQWFDEQDFLLLQEAEQLVGFCWLKIEKSSGTGTSTGTGTGEFYAVGVDPDYQGKRLGDFLMQAGFRRLAERGIETANLYVEAENGPALKLYSRFGFTEFSRDIQYQRG